VGAQAQKAGEQNLVALCRSGLFSQPLFQFIRGLICINGLVDFRNSTVNQIFKLEKAIPVLWTLLNNAITMR
jgi:hypothetical protein